MGYKGLDFDGDKPMQYKEVRIMMAEIFEETNVSAFGPTSPFVVPEIQGLSKEEQAKNKQKAKNTKDLIKRGQKRILEKVKEIRQNFSKAVVTGSRSGSGKLVYEFYDKLITLWGGCANTAPLLYDVSSDNLNDEQEPESHFPNTTGTSIFSLSPQRDGDIQSNQSDEELQEGNSDINGKRPATCVTKLIDNKRKHLEKTLSAAQRDQLLIKDSNEDFQFRKDLTKAMQQSTEALSQYVKEVRKAMTELGAGVSRSIEMLAHSLRQTHLHPVNQNLFTKATTEMFIIKIKKGSLINQCKEAMTCMKLDGSKFHQNNKTYLICLVSMNKRMFVILNNRTVYLMLLYSVHPL